MVYYDILNGTTCTNYHIDNSKTRYNGTTDTNTTSISSTCKSGNISGCSYGWLYDRTSTSCRGYGCLNNADASDFYGYWTSISASGYSYEAWNVSFNGSLNYYYVEDDYRGIRPVIMLFKSSL